MSSEVRRRMRAVLTIALVNGLAVIHGCSGSGDSSSSGGGGGSTPPPCMVSLPTECPDPAPKYADVAPVLEQKCVTCHSGVANGPWPLTDYDHVASWQNEIRSELASCSMPPLDAGVSITEDERTLILAWLRCGAPQ